MTDKLATDVLFADADGWRDTVVNWEAQLERLVDDYQPYATLDQAIQKDAIQNSWDGRLSRRKAKGWRCVFDLAYLKDGRRILTVTDAGTTGLTGRVLTAEEYETYLPETEKWARFESLAFTHAGGASADYLGARGQGKFIFVGASKQRRILYDSLRADGTYRLGMRYVTRTSSPVNSWDNAEGVARLHEFAAELSPLTEVGTRVIIDDPVDEVADAITSGRMARNIAETWWPILEKFGADIRVAITKPTVRHEAQVKVPEELRLPTSDNKKWKVWLKENQRFDLGGDRYAIKRAHFAWQAAGAVSPELEGIALVRGGMVVTRLEMTGVPRKVAAAVTGFVEFDEALDLEMKRIEHPTHYTFNLRRGVGLKVKHWVEDELAAFAAAKLGFGGDKQGAADRLRRDAERRALEAFNKKARELGLVGPRGLGGGGGGGGHGGGGRLPISIRLAPPVMPRADSRRINYGEAINALSLRAVNTTPDVARVRVSMYVTRDSNILSQLVKDRELDVAPGSMSPWTPAETLTLGKEDFLPGPYVVRAKLLVLESPHRPRMWEERDSFKFWVEEDPPQGGLFDDIVALKYPPEVIRVDAEAIRTANGWVFQYNLLHPAYQRVSGSEEELSEYLFGLMLRELVYVDLSSAEPVLFKAADLEDYRSQQRRSSHIVSDVLYDYYEQ